MWWGRILIVNILFQWCRLKNFFPILLRLSHWFSKTHSAVAASSRTDPALGRRQAWLCSDKDMLNSASHYLHFFSPASRKLKGMQINTGLCEGIVMSWNNEVQCILFHCGAWLDCQDLTEGRRGVWIRRENLIGTESGRHLPKYAGLSCHVLLSVVWLLFRLSVGPKEFAPGSQWLGFALLPHTEWWTSASAVKRSWKLRWGWREAKCRIHLGNCIMEWKPREGRSCRKIIILTTSHMIVWILVRWD